MDSQLERSQSDLAQTHREKERLHGDHEVTKQDLSKVAGNLRTSNVLLKALQQKIEDLDGDVRTLQMGATKMGRNLLEQTEKVAHAREFSEGLNSRHLELVKDVGDLAKSHGDTDSTLRKLMRTCDNADAALQTELARLRDHLESLENRLGKTQQNVQETTDNLKLTDTGLRLLRTSLDHDEGSSKKVDSLHMWRDSASTNLKETMATVTKLETALAAVQNITNSDKESFDHMLKNLESKVLINSGKIEKLNTSVQSQGEQLKKNELAIVRVQKGVDGLAEQADMLHADQKGLRAAQTEVAYKMEMQRLSLSKAQADLQQTGREIETTTKHLFSLKDSLTETNVNMSKMGNRYDTCTRNILGMSKGFQDISRHVVQGEHGLLAPKTARRLPDIVLSPGGAGSMTGEQTFEPRRPLER